MPKPPKTKKSRSLRRAAPPVALAFRAGDKIGLAEAEDDKELFADCFVDTGALQALQDSKDPRCIVVGRTGVGKTALLDRLASGDRVVRIEPANLALEFISNSNVLSFFEGLGVNVDVFYKLLWRHCFCVELLRKRFNSANFFERWIERLGKYKEAYKYLSDWGDSQLWNSTHLTNTIVTGRLEKKVRAALGGKYRSAELSGEFARSLSKEEQEYAQSGAKKVISEAHSKDLQALMQLVDDALDDDQKPWLVVIDKLDEDWVENDIRYKLIHALIETARKFREVRNAKVILAARIDLLQTLTEKVQPAGFQAEKWKSNYLEITWSRQELLTLLDLRINKVLKSRYSNRAKIGHVDVFPSGQVEYLLARTLQRPRDLIEFVNRCIKQAGATQLTPTTVKEAEREYSRERLESLRDEWRERYPSLDRVARTLLQGMNASLSLGDLQSQVVRERVTLLAASAKPSEPLPLGLAEAGNDDGRFRIFVAEAIVALGTAGILAVKVSPTEPFASGPEDMRSVRGEQLDSQTSLRVHPMLHKALGIRV